MNSISLKLQTICMSEYLSSPRAKRSVAEGRIQNTKSLLLLSNAVNISFHIKMKIQAYKDDLVLLNEVGFTLLTKLGKNQPITSAYTHFGICKF